MQALILFDDGSVDISPLSMVEAFQEETHDVEKTYKINWIFKAKKVGVTCRGKILRYGTREVLKLKESGRRPKCIGKFSGHTREQIKDKKDQGNHG